MKSTDNAQSARRNRRGAMLALIAICLPVLLLFAGFSINIAQMQLSRTELRTATDAASRAGARTLSIRQDETVARNAAIEAAGRNKVAGSPLLVVDADLQFGLVQENATGRWAFNPVSTPGDPKNSLRVTGRRTDGSPSGGIPVLFPAFNSHPTFEPVKVATATQIDRDIILVLDRSGSMTEGVSGPPGPWNAGDAAPANCRWLALTAAVEAFLVAVENTPQDEKVGLTTYSTTATHEQDLTLDYSLVRTRVQAHTDQFWGGWTAVGDGLDLGWQAVVDPSFTRPYAAKTVVLMTDGNHNTGGGPVPVARNAHDNHNVTVHTITFSSGANQALMRDTAAAGGGRHWHADDAASLIDAFEEIANNLPTLLTE